MHLFDWFFRQPVTEGEMDEAFESAEIADQRITSDAGLIGIMLNGSTAQHSAVPDLTVDVSTPMVAYDQQGQRIGITGTGGVENIDVSVDSSAVSTSVVAAPNEKWVSIFARFDRVLSTPRTDGNGATVQFDRDEGFEIIVTQGAEAPIGTATRPALMSDAILIADVRRTFGQTQILNANISSTRTQRAFTLSTTDFTISEGTAEEAMQAILQELQNHIDDTGVAHPASAIVFDAANLPIPVGWTAVAAANDVQAALDGIVDDLAQTDGGARVGTVIAATWADSSTVAATNVDLVLEEIVTDLSGTGGAARIGAVAFGNLAAGTVRSQLNELDNEKGGLALGNTWTGINTWSNANIFNALTTLNGQVDINGNATFDGTLNFTDLEGTAFSLFNQRWHVSALQVTHGGGSEQIFSLFTPSNSGEVGIVDLIVLGWRDNDEDLRHIARFTVGYGRTTGGTSGVGMISLDDIASGGGPGITGFSVGVTSQAIVVNATGTTAATTNNYLCVWRRTQVAGDQ